MIARPTLAKKVVAIMGLPGAGKSTIKRCLFTLDPAYTAVINITTRQPRINDGRIEQNGVDYIFTDTEEFCLRVDQGEIVNTTTVAGHLYGTELQQYTSAFARGGIPVVDFDIAGYIQLRSVISNLGADIQAFFITPSSAKQWRTQFITRYDDASDGNNSWDRRLLFAINEIRQARHLSQITYIVNSSPESSAQKIASLISSSVPHGSQSNSRIAAVSILEDILRLYE